MAKLYHTSPINVRRTQINQSVGVPLTSNKKLDKWNRAGSLNTTSVSASKSKSASTSTSDSPAAKKILIFKSFSESPVNHLKKIDKQK